MENALVIQDIQGLIVIFLFHVHPIVPQRVMAYVKLILLVAAMMDLKEKLAKLLNKAAIIPLKKLLQKIKIMLIKLVVKIIAITMEFVILFWGCVYVKADILEIVAKIKRKI